MINLCRIVHLQYHHMPEFEIALSGSLEVIAKEVSFMVNLAIASDKYGCASSLRSAVEMTFRRFFELDCSKSSYWAQLLVAAYLLDDAYAFKKITNRLLTDETAMPFHNMGAIYDPDERVPLEVYEQLHARRSAVDQHLIWKLNLPMWTFLPGTLSASHHIDDAEARQGDMDGIESLVIIHDRLLTTEYIRELQRQGLFPIVPQRWSLKTVASSLSDFSDLKDIKGVQKANGDSYDCNSCHHEIQEDMLSLGANVLLRCEGLCLDCLQAGSYLPGPVVATGTAGGSAAEERKCRIAHISNVGDVMIKKAEFVQDHLQLVWHHST
ncbi:hypothetical protein EJ08DRAFT_193337 [Tothia fuscella]|uniref:Uncharacterized protein n=1 Tax=Tothia fuscella TaxID=1048955 RepID=A0A9P4NT89_9PEZI|nr:hypothetical protein EJ08DRAFT_193337 [Tothia fuscella]